MAASSNVVAMAETLLSMGAEVRQLRRARCMTLKELAQAAGISVSYASAIERSAAKPSLDVLTAIAAALDVTVDWFFAPRPGAGPMERAYVVRGRNRRDLNALYGEDPSALGYSDALLSSSIGGQFYMGIATYAPMSERPDETMHKHEGEEHGYVLEGELEMQIGDERITLRAGDSYSFDARIPHHARNRTDRVCQLVWVVSPVVIPKDVAQPEDAASRKPAS